eukprot:m51a1_g3178 hypothetical protein (353) ;mRNA; f:408338-409651
MNLAPALQANIPPEAPAPLVSRAIPELDDARAAWRMSGGLHTAVGCPWPLVPSLRGYRSSPPEGYWPLPKDVFVARNGAYAQRLDPRAGDVSEPGSGSDDEPQDSARQLRLAVASAPPRPAPAPRAHPKPQPELAGAIRAAWSFLRGGDGDGDGVAELPRDTRYAILSGAQAEEVRQLVEAAVPALVSRWVDEYAVLPAHARPQQAVEMAVEAMADAGVPWGVAHEARAAFELVDLAMQRELAQDLDEWTMFSAAGKHCFGHHLLSTGVLPSHKRRRGADRGAGEQQGRDEDDETEGAEAAAGQQREAGGEEPPARGQCKLEAPVAAPDRPSTQPDRPRKRRRTHSRADQSV